MNEFWTVLGAVLPVFCVAGMGVIMRRLEWLTEEADQSLLRITINVFAPCLILDSILGNAALRVASNVIVPPLVGFGTVAMGMGLAWLLRGFTGLKTAQEQRTFTMSAGLYNYGYVPIPLALMLFGQETVGVLFVHNVGVETALWTLGLILLTGASPGREWRKIINVPLAAIAVGLILNFLGVGPHLPPFLLTTARMLGQCAIPLGIVLIGATIADQAHHVHSRASWPVIAVACGARLLLLPLLFLAIARYLPCSLELKRVMVLQAAMPAAVFPIVMTRHYGGDAPTALRVVLGTSIASLVTTPLWIRIGVQWVENGLYGL